MLAPERQCRPRASERPRLGSRAQRLSRPHLKAEMVAAVPGKRGRLYLMREQLLEVSQPALDFITELVHRSPRTWPRDVERLHALLLDYDNAAMQKAFWLALDGGAFSVEYVAHHLRRIGRPTNIIPLAGNGGGEP